jgi:protein involved in polysaccharide export with SLBB domain
MKYVNRRTVRLAAAVATASTLLIVAAGCESKPVTIDGSKAPAFPATRPAVLMAGDELEIKFYRTPELNVQQRVRADGMITLQLVGDVQVSGKTPTEVGDSLRQAYAQHLVNPDVTIIVRSMYSRRLIVTGEVLRPGVLDVPGQMSLMEAIGQVGGFALNTANIKQVIVSRVEPETGKRVGYAVNMEQEYKGAMTQPFMLQPTDIVIVPRTTVVEINQWMRQYITNNIPGGGTVFYSQAAGNGSITVSGSNAPN